MPKEKSGTSKSKQKRVNLLWGHGVGKVAMQGDDKSGIVTAANEPPLSLCLSKLLAGTHPCWRVCIRRSIPVYLPRYDPDRTAILASF